MIIETTNFYILIIVPMTFTFIQGHNCMKKIKTFCLIFSSISQSIWMESGMLPKLVGLFKLMPDWFSGCVLLCGVRPKHRTLLK